MIHFRSTTFARAFRSLLFLAVVALAQFNCEYLFDIEPPKIEIVTPRIGVPYFGALPLELKVTDNYKVQKVEVFLDDESVDEFTKGPFTAQISFSTSGRKTATIKVTAHDRAGNFSETERDVVLDKETISRTPNTPSGSSSGTINTPYTYSTGGSSSNAGHSLEYRFDWGGSSYSIWSSSTSASHAWSSAGTYSVKAQARCATHPSVVSNWSSSKTVTITSETVSAPITPTGSS
ncbi:MAG: Ig-like domain-containing protein, partial [Candidatus Neomarinimicrobiota bacterium]